jgi:hypothetical protein
MPLEDIQEVLGHASLITTKKLFAGHVRAEHIAQQLATYGRDPR